MKYLLRISLIMSIFLFNCQNKKEVNPNSSNPDFTLSKFHFNSVNKEVQLLENDGINFDYELGEKSNLGENKQIEINYTVKNNNEFDVNFIAESCNALDYFLRFKTEYFKIIPLVNCNATFPIIGRLKAKEEMLFTTHLLQIGGLNSEPVIGLDFRVVDKYIEYEKLLEQPEIIENVYQSSTTKNNIIWKKK
jgi:hypothetical protein